MKLSAFMDETRRQFSLIVALFHGRSANWIEESLAHLEAEIHEVGGILPQPKGSYTPKDARSAVQGAAADINQPLFLMIKKKKRVGVQIKNKF